MKAVAVIVALFGLTVAAPLSGSPTGTGRPSRPTGTGAPGHHEHHGHHSHPPFPAFTGGSQSFTGVRPEFTSVRHSGAPLSQVPSRTGLPSQSIAARDLPVYPSNSFTGRRPEHTGAPHSFSGDHPRPTGSMVRGDERPGGWPRPSGFPHSFSGVRPSATGVHHSGAPPSEVPRPTDLPSQSIEARDLPVSPSDSFSGRHPEHTGAPHSFSGEHPHPTGSMVRGDERPGGWPRPSGFPHSFSGVRPSFTRSHPAPSQSA
ncbi:unnamed protein product [Rhizoctonia solani]|uniref:Uncharacterized protein n=1 Tax=Rhizoctonia solani TaxID=456999 RepID=A0A8H3H8S2_9AGAM|nr:unnamed protein product [Rhizoctonia solani]